MIIIIKGVTHQVALSSAVPPGSQATIADMIATTSKINEKGEILQQDAINCEVLNIQDAKNIFDCIGYKEIMTIKEKHFSYYKGNFKIIVKILSENNILIEAETNKEYRTVEKLKKEINNTNIPFDNSNYFVKKAEEELEKIKNGEF